MDLLVNALHKKGVKIEKLSLEIEQMNHLDVVHIHWPEHYLRKLSRVKHIKLLFRFVRFICVAKKKGIPIVWTVHNVNPHELQVPKSLASIYFGFWHSMVDGCVYMALETKKQAEQDHVELSKKSAVIIPHGHYLDVIGDSLSKVAARNELGLDSDVFVLFF